MKIKTRFSFDNPCTSVLVYRKSISSGKRRIYRYVVLQGAVDNLLSNIECVKNYCNQNFMLSETEYYLSSLEIVALFFK